MAIAVVCTCGREFEFDDEYAGQEIKCPDCSQKVVVPEAPARVVPWEGAFDREKFLINQKIRIDAKYAVTDENGNPVLYIVRPTYLLRGLVAIFGGIASGLLWVGLIGSLADKVGASTALGTLLTFLAVFGCFGLMFGVALALSKKRHTMIYRDETLGTPLVTIEQDSKYQIINHTYSVRDQAGRLLAKLRKNIFTNIIRKRWWMTSPGGAPIMNAVEDSIWKAFLRRWLGPAFGLLRTNFLIQRGETDDPVGVFNRRFTILDRYVLDIDQDPQRKMDRRLVLALAIMLDTGERR